jgi:cadmium resistance protein CadD (predicted permease)
VSIALVGQAVGLFAVTNIDDIVILALFFGRTVGRSGRIRVVAGQYVGFAAILAASVAGALGAGLLPEAAIAYLGLLPLALGLRAAWRSWREHRSRTAVSEPSDDEAPEPGTSGPGVLAVAAVTLANGGDNIGVYVPVFTTAGTAGLITYIAVFLVLVAVWCAAGLLLAGRPLVARALSRWGHILLPVVLIAVGLIILVDGRAFGL